MATGTGPYGANIGGEITRVTPNVNLDTNAEAVANALTNAGQFVNKIVTNKLEDVAREKGAREGAEMAARQAAGEKLQNIHAPLIITSVSEARKAAAQEAYLAGVKTDIDTREQQMRRDHAYDPEGYEKTGRDVISGFIQNTPPEYAVAVERYANSRLGQGFDVIADARAKKDIQEQSQTIQARETSIEQNIMDLAAGPGGELNPEFDGALHEWDDLQTAKAANPLFAYTPEQAAVKRQGLLTKVQGVIVTRNTVEAYNAAGGGLPGYAAAKRHLSEQFMDGPEFASMPEGKRARLAQEALKNLDIAYAGDRETARLEDQKEQDSRRQTRELVGEFRLGVVTGGVSREEILKAEIPDTDKASLLNMQKAQERSAAAAARSAASADRLAQSLNYKNFADDASAGVLTDGHIADATHAGLLTQGQARTLAARRDKTLAPMVKTMMAPVRDAVKRPGMTTRGTAEKSMQAEQQALRWAQVNPNATLEQQYKAGHQIAEVYFGSGASKQPGPGAAGGGQAAAASDKSGKLRALDARKGSLTPQQYKAQRRDILDGK